MGDQFSGLSVVGNPFAPDVLADEAMVFEIVNGTVRITFAVLRMVEPVAPSPNQFVTVGRLVISVVGAQNLVVGLNDFLEKQGFSPSGAVGGGRLPN